MPVRELPKSGILQVTVVAARYDRKKVLIASDLARAVIVLLFLIDVDHRVSCTRCLVDLCTIDS